MGKWNETQDPMDELSEAIEEMDNTDESNAPSPSEDEKRKAHEEAEVKRKDEWEAKKKAREEADLAKWEKVTAMDADKLMEIATTRVREDTEKLTRRNMKECISEHIQVLCYEDPKFACQVMYPRKSMQNCFRYVNRQAREYVKQEMEDNGIKPSSEGYGCDVPDDLCYQWAAEYFWDMEAPEDKKG